jgi:molybdenum cofactor cytidylyltransferase
MLTLSPIVLLLAAGQATRWREEQPDTHKLTADLADSSVFTLTLKHVQAAGLPIGLCVSSHTPASIMEIARREDIPHHICSGGMGDVISQAVATWQSPAGWLMLPADMPCVAPATIREVARQLRIGKADCVAPTHGGLRGHPVAFSVQCQASLLALRGDAGARSVLDSHLLRTMECDDAGILLDIDTPADRDRAEDFLQHHPR